MSSQASGSDNNGRSTHKKPTVVVFAGAGTKGIFGYLGPVYGLQVMDWFENVHTFAGTSIGSIFAFSQCLDIPAKYLMKLAWSLNLSSYLRELSITSFLQKGYGVETSLLRPFILKILHFRFPEREDITFEELFKLSGKYFVCNAVEKNNLATHVIFSVENTPKHSVIEAIEKSCALPLLFKPLKDKKNDKEYIDGGLINNFLVDYFDDKTESILGIRFKKIIPVFKQLENEDISGFENDESFIQILTSMTNPFLSSVQVLKYLIWIFLVQNREMEVLRYKNVKFDQIEIDPLDLTTISVFISNRDKIDIFYNSLSQTVAFLHTKTISKTHI
jgi:hypothetical protein